MAPLVGQPVVRDSYNFVISLGFSITHQNTTPSKCVTSSVISGISNKRSQYLSMYNCVTDAFEMDEPECKVISNLKVGFI